MVDLPDPDGPTTATVSPDSTVKLRPRNTGTGPAALSNVRWTSWRRSIVSAIASGYGMRRRVLKAATALVALCAVAASPAGAAPDAAATRILVLGDSIAAGYGLPPDRSFPARLESKLNAEGHEVKVINGSVSGDTTAGGKARLDWALAGKPDVAIVELGGNDGLRGIPPGQTKANLEAILARLKAAKVRVLLTGMLAPPNMGQSYEQAFNALFPSLARRYGVAFYPFLLDGIAAQPALNQPDGIHPNDQGVAVLVDRLAPYVVRLLERPR